MNFKFILNNSSPQAHMESEFDFGIAGKLVKYVVHSSERKI